MDRVLSTQEAKDAIGNIKKIIENGLAEQLRQLDVNGQKLSDKNVWDGPLANTFRNETWKQTHDALQKAKTELENLQKSLHNISTNIFTAGGGS